MSQVKTGMIDYPNIHLCNPYWYTPSNPLWSTSNAFGMNPGFQKQALITSIPSTGTITAVCFNLEGSLTGQAMYVSMQNLDGNANPLGTGSLYGGSLQTYYNGPLNINSLTDITLSSPATGVIQGDMVAVVFEWAGPAASITGNINFAIAGDSFAYISSSGTVWTINKTSRPQIGFKYSDNNYYSNVPLLDNTASKNADSATEYGMKIQLPFTCKCYGGFMFDYNSFATQNVAFSLFQGTGVLATVVKSSKFIGLATLTSFFFSSSITLNANTAYYISVANQDANQVILAETLVSNNAYFNTWPMGTGCYEVTRSSSVTWSNNTPTYQAVNWTENPTKKVPLGIYIDSVDNGLNTGGGSNILHPQGMFIPPY